MDLFKEFGVKDHRGGGGADPGHRFRPALRRRTRRARPPCAADRAMPARMSGSSMRLDHGVPEELIDRAFAASRRFHALPLDEKLKLG